MASHLSLEEGEQVPRQLLRSLSLGLHIADPSKLDANSSMGTTGHSPKGGKASSKLDRRSHSYRLDRPKKGGAGGKGTWGSLLDNGSELRIDPKDPNYDSEEEPYKLVSTPIAESLEEYKGKVVQIVEEYFTTNNVEDCAANLRELGCPGYHHHFVKKLVSMSMDRHDREKEMAAVLLSALYADVIQSDQLAKGFLRVLESIDDLILDIPDAIDISAVFIARAIVDDILPPAFLTKTLQSLPEGCKGKDVVQIAEKSYLSAPLHAEIVERRWGGSTRGTVEEVKKKISALLKEYLDSGDKSEACRCIRELNVPFFHHEVVKQALILVMEKRSAEASILSLLKETADEGLITLSQMSKGFARVSDYVEDLSLDIPDAREVLPALVSKATSEGWLVALVTTTRSSYALHEPSSVDEVTTFKRKAANIIQEYFLSDDIGEVIRSLEELASPQLNSIFIKKLITSAMDRKSREKEMASVLLSALYGEAISSEDVMKAFVVLLDSAADLALDILDAVNELSLFLARAVVDDILVPLDVDDIYEQLKPGSLGAEIVHAARALLHARHAGERILRCWGGGTGWAIEDAKDKIVKLLEEFEAGGDMAEACRCIRDLDMPFFHHEVVKKALVMAMEKKNDKLLDLLHECSNEGLITINQMSKGFARVADGLDDLTLDIPNACQKFASYVQKAKGEGWVTSELTSSPKAPLSDTNGLSSAAAAAAEN